MSGIKAKEHYLGKGGKGRMNCAQSVVAALDKDDMLAEYSMYGGGCAPDGWCGAAYAAAQLTGNAEKVEQTFRQLGGGITCSELRGLRKLSCVGCVETAGKLAEI